MNAKPGLSWVVLSLFLLISSPSLAGVEIEFMEKADFGEYKTFAWRAGSIAAKEMVERRLHLAVERELEAKGLAKAEGDVADVYVATHVSVDARDWTTRHTDPGQIGSEYNAVGYSSAQVMTIGHVRIDIVDGVSEEVVWQARAKKKAASTMSKVMKQVDKLIAKMFKKFPPKK